MNNCLKFFNLILLLLLNFFVLISCVDNVEDGELDENIAKTIPQDTIKYEGISSLMPISDNKVEVYFPPYKGNQADITYIISYDGSLSKIYIEGKDLSLDLGSSQFRYVYTDLDINTEYSFNVQVVDKEGKKSVNTKKLIQKTYSNKTADFFGILSVANLSGLEGKTGAYVEWIEAPTNGSLITKNEEDPIQYEIDFLNSDLYQPSDIDDSSIVEPYKKTIIVAGDKRSVVVNGLQPGQEYYVRVRSKHFGLLENSSSSDYFSESNNKFLKIKTFDLNSNILFDKNSLEVVIPSDYTSLNSVNLSWSQASGIFDHYRIYYAAQSSLMFNLGGHDQCFGEVSSNPGLFCKKIDGTELTSILNNLEALQDYFFILVVCADYSCSPITFKKSNIVYSLRDSVNIIEYQGILNIKDPISSNSLNELVLEVDVPNFNTGMVDGVDIFHFATVNTDFSMAELLSTSNSSEGLKINNFNYLQDSIITVSGTNLASTYCFQTYPYIYDINNPTEKIYYYKSIFTPTCIQPQIKAPNSENFAGIIASSVNCQNGIISFQWNNPSEGVYDNIEVFLVNASTFNIFQAENYQNNNYERFLLSKNQTSFYLSNLTSGQVSFGIRSYYKSVNEIIYRGAPLLGEGTCSL